MTTRFSVTETSGRGVGMSAFRQRLQALAGYLEVRSGLRQGTSWLIRFDWPTRAHVAPAELRVARPG